MNLETKITIYKFTPQLFTLTPYSSTPPRSMSEYHKKNMIIQSLQKAQPVYLPKPHHEDFLLP